MKHTKLMRLAFAAALLAPGVWAAEREIAADVSKVKGPRSMIWQDCVGAGRVGEGLRDGWRRQLEICKKEIGFKYLRAHGLLCDDLGVYTERDGKVQYNWQYIDDVYDFLLDSGIKPFVEFGFMPNDLASGTATVFWWKGNITPPKDYAKWDALITALVQHWTDRYGADEVKTWRFEVWNEPSLGMFFKPPQGKTPREAYFELYEHTAKAVKAVNKDYAVGGPAGAGPVWLPELIQLCSEKKIPLDFISFHSYGLGGGPSGLDETGTSFLYLNKNDINAPATIVNKQIPILKNTAMPNLPIHITEWSASYSPRDQIHDSYYSAPYILDQLRKTEGMSSMSYWTFTDVFEENGPGPRPFHGGFGLINYQGIKKPAFWAYWMLNQLGNTEIVNADKASYVCKDDKGGVQLLFWDLNYPITKNLNLQQGEKPVSNQEFFTSPHPAKEIDPAKIKLSNIPAGSYKMTTYRIGYKINDPYSQYIEMGRPIDLSRQDVAKLNALSTNKPVDEKTVQINGDFTANLPMLENSVYFITLTPVK